MHRFNICLVVVLLWCESTINLLYYYITINSIITGGGPSLPLCLPPVCAERATDLQLYRHLVWMTRTISNAQPTESVETTVVNRVNCTTGEAWSCRVHTVPLPALIHMLQVLKTLKSYLKDRGKR